MLRKLVVCGMLISHQVAHADAGVAIGLNFTYYGDVGITIKALSSDKNNEQVFAIGTTYYPFAEKKLGIDLGFGGAAFNVVGLIGIDILQDAAYLSVGYENMSTQ
jgi:hypothetical protein